MLLGQGHLGYMASEKLVKVNLLSHGGSFCFGLWKTYDETNHIRYTFVNDDNIITSKIYGHLMLMSRFATGSCQNWLPDYVKERTLGWGLSLK